MSPSKEFRQLVTDRLTELMEEADLWNTCLNCTAFDEATEHCGQSKPPARPPARIIAFGCPSFQDGRGIVEPLPRIAAPATAPDRKIPPRSGFDDFDDDIPF